MCEQVHLDQLGEHLDSLHRSSSQVEIIDGRDKEVIATLVGISFYGKEFQKPNRPVPIQTLKANLRYYVLGWPPIKVLTKAGSSIAVLVTISPNSR